MNNLVRKCTDMDDQARLEPCRNQAALAFRAANVGIFRQIGAADSKAPLPAAALNKASRRSPVRGAVKSNPDAQLPRHLHARLKVGQHFPNAITH
jgi:hypothetical protein